MTVFHPADSTQEAAIAEAIGAVRQKGFAAALWGLCRSLARPDNLIVLAYRDAGPPVVLVQRPGHPQVFQRLEATYLAGAYRLDPFFALHLNRAGDGAYRLRDIAPDAFRRSRYFVDYFGGTTLVDEIVFVVPLAEGLSLSLCLGRDATSGRAFGAADMAACVRLSPVVSALARAEWQGLDRGTGPLEDTPALLINAARQQGIALSPRQATVGLMILRGHSTPSIALSLGVSPQTVKVFRKQLYARCGISSQAELFSLMLPLLKG
ncbi:helix-turn-helix transcriptional regulator [Tabrizicola sp.]|jgi:DNA-binding CsgD family transcriptional regulator|uniref:helix-turn-helix transcriptional regulator n=1 Tax=Tabrizicola sp. TaxID=2005166 RepID=UPI0025F2BFAB|nr:helix-turn-helix transcriptional regulator [Tabrizicola sp.]